MNQAKKEFIDKFYPIVKEGVRNKFGGRYVYRKFTGEVGEVWQFIEKLLSDQLDEVVGEAWEGFVENIIFMVISEFSGCDPHDNLMEEQKQLYFRLAKEWLDSLKKRRGGENGK